MTWRPTLRMREGNKWPGGLATNSSEAAMIQNARAEATNSTEANTQNARRQQMAGGGTQQMAETPS